MPNDNSGGDHENATEEQQIARLQIAVVFDCPVCGAENFIRPQARTASGEEKDEIVRNVLGLSEFEEPPESEVEFNSIPAHVSCEACSNAFDSDPTELMAHLGATYYDPDDDGDEEDDDED